jgi:PPOX class probable F420-dependent enzyme
MTEESGIPQRVEDARVGRLATVSGDGRPHLVPCCFAVVGRVLYSAVDAKPKSSLALKRLSNIRANPSAALIVDHYEEDWSALWWVRLDGTALVVESASERQRALERLAAKYPQYRATAPPGPVIAIDVQTWRCWPEP